MQNVVQKIHWNKLFPIHNFGWSMSLKKVVCFIAGCAVTESEASSKWGIFIIPNCLQFGLKILRKVKNWNIFSSIVIFLFLIIINWLLFCVWTLNSGRRVHGAIYGVAVVVAVSFTHSSQHHAAAQNSNRGGSRIRLNMLLKVVRRREKHTGTDQHSSSREAMGTENLKISTVFLCFVAWSNSKMLSSMEFWFRAGTTAAVRPNHRTS